MADGLFLNKQGLFCYGFNAMITAWGQFPKFIHIYGSSAVQLDGRIVKRKES